MNVVICPGCGKEHPVTTLNVGDPASMKCADCHRFSFVYVTAKTEYAPTVDPPQPKTWRDLPAMF